MTIPSRIAFQKFQNYLNDEGLEAKRTAAANPPAAPASAPPAAATSGAPAKSGNAPTADIAPSKAAAAASPAPKNDYLEDYQKKVSSLLDRLGNTEAEDERAKNMAIMKAGLAMAAGRDPNFLSNVATGAMAGVEDYGTYRDTARKSAAARTAAEIEALGTAAKLQQDREQNAALMDYRNRDLAREEAYNKAMVGVYGQRAAETQSNAVIRAAASQYAVNDKMLRDPMSQLTKEQRDHLEATQEYLRNVMSGVDPSLAGGSMSLDPTAVMGAPGAPVVPPELRAAAAAKAAAIRSGQQ